MVLILIKNISKAPFLSLYRSEAGYGWCLVTFFLVYYFSLAGTLWFVMLAYAWNVSFKSLGSTQSRLAGKTQYFHIVAWMTPVILTIVVLISEEVRKSI